jgi:sulfite reductase (NADPH) flavoprotein alpha-component
MPHDQTLSTPSPVAPIARPKSFALPALRQVWFQVHWFIGITAGSVLMVIGLTGGTLAFRDELLAWINPGVRMVAPQTAAMLAPQQIIEAVQKVHADQRVTAVTVFSAPGAAARVNFAPPPGERRGETVYVHPYNGAMQLPLRAADFFEWVESLHRWLLLPRDTGRVVAGTLALCLLGMALSGLYLRWPRRPLDWRSWLSFDPKLKGRPFLWGLHSVLGTCVLLVYLVSTTTGLYWGFDFVETTIDSWAGATVRPERAAAPARAARGERTKDANGKRARGEGRPDAPNAATEAPSVDLSAAWSSFAAHAGPWQQATLRVPERATQALQVTWLAADAPHERARNRMSINLQSGEVAQDERYSQQSSGDRLITLVYPLHTGTYFGVPGRLIMMLAALSLPIFGVTGWMLYLGRRKLKRAAGLERRRLTSAPSATATYRDQQDPVLVAFASQTGHAERLALHSAGILQRAGMVATVQSLDRLRPEDLQQHTRVLIVASSFGEGDPPDGVRRFVRLLDQGDAKRMGGLRYALLALGDRGYASFCGFGHALDRRLQSLGAQALFPLIEVDRGNADAVARWSATLGELAGVPLDEREQTVALDTARPVEPYRVMKLKRRTLLNEGSIGGPLFEVAFAIDGSFEWQSGALIEVMPHQSDESVAAWLAAAGLDGTARVDQRGIERTLYDALVRSDLPVSSTWTSPQDIAERLQSPVPRRYSVASLPQDGELQLLVRQERHEWGLGLASGWLTMHAPIETEVELRLVDNPGFEATIDDVPCMFIGNGSGLAGLRAHLRARVRAGRRQNWLLFGERNRVHDRLCADELQRWSDTGVLSRVDLAFSRDGGDRPYVQDHLLDAAIEVRSWIEKGAIVYVCGSLQGMASGVDAALEQILGAEAFEDLIATNRYRRDIY